MYWFRKQLLICTASHCMQKGANQVAGRLRMELKRRGLDHAILANTCDSIEICDLGPNIVVLPEGTIYRGVQVKDIPKIIRSLQEDGEPVESLVLTRDSEDEVQRRRFYEAATESDAVPLEAFMSLAAEYGYDQAWVDEQARRGFIARKERDGQPVITVTSKARNRYGIEILTDHSGRPRSPAS
jgi:(2Fe-2S) ferredoxin